VLTPARWGKKTFDRVAQQFVWLIVDEAGKELPLVLSYTDLTRLGIEHLENRDDPKLHSVSVVGRVLRDSAQLAIEPLALIPAMQSSFSSINLLVPAPGAKAQNTSAMPAPSPEEASEIEDTEPDEETMRATSQWLRLARDYLVAHAEAGATAGHQRTAVLSDPAEKLANSGLPILSRALSQIERGALFGGLLLRAAYIAKLHEQKLASR
jgi:hypothetical protein